MGAHGLELAPEADRWRDEIHAFASGVDWPVEDKGLTVSFHYREAADEIEALEYLEKVAEKARRSGLVPRFGRKVLEIRPPVHADKGTAVDSCSTKQASAARCTPETTRPTRTRSAHSTASRSAYASPSRRTRRRTSSCGSRTSSSPLPQSS